MSTDTPVAEQAVSLSAQARLLAKPKKVRPITVDGETFWIRSLTTKENGDAVNAATNKTTFRFDHEQYKREVFVRSVLESETGGRAFSDKDVSLVIDLEQYVVVPIVEAIDQLNTFGEVKGYRP